MDTNIEAKSTEERSIRGRYGKSTLEVPGIFSLIATERVELRLIPYHEQLRPYSRFTLRSWIGGTEATGHEAEAELHKPTNRKLASARGLSGLVGIELP